MRSKVWLLSMGAALTYAILAIVFANHFGSAILVIAVALIWNILAERRIARAKAMRSMLTQKYPQVNRPDIQYVSEGRTATLTDAFVKSALLCRIRPEDYESKRSLDQKQLEKLYAAIMTGNYTCNRYTLLSKKRTPDTDGPDHCHLICEHRQYVVSETAMNLCHVGDTLIEVCIAEHRGWGVVIRLDYLNNDHCVIYP